MSDHGDALCVEVRGGVCMEGVALREGGRGPLLLHMKEAEGAVVHVRYAVVRDGAEVQCDGRKKDEDVVVRLADVWRAREGGESVCEPPVQSEDRTSHTRLGGGDMICTEHVRLVASWVGRRKPSAA